MHSSFFLCYCLALVLSIQFVSGAETAACPKSDQDLWLSQEFAVVEENLQFCGLDSLGQEAAARACLQARSDFSDTCLDCQVNLITCTVQFCTTQCANGGRKNKKCVECVQDGSPCNNNFVTCTGFSFPSCPECVQPASNSEGFIPGTSFEESIGIVVGAGAGGLVMLAVIIYFACVRDSRVDFNPSQHSMHDLASQGSMQKLGSFHTNGSPTLGAVKLYANSDDASAPAYMSSSSPAFSQQNSASQLRPFDPIMQEI